MINLVPGARKMVREQEERKKKHALDLKEELRQNEENYLKLKAHMKAEDRAIRDSYDNSTPSKFVNHFWRDLVEFLKGINKLNWKFKVPILGLILWILTPYI